MVCPGRAVQGWMGARMAPEQGEEVESRKGGAKASARGEWPWKKVGQTSQGGGRKAEAGSGRGRKALNGGW